MSFFRPLDILHFLHSRCINASSLAQVWLHVVFSTKDRQTYLQNSRFRKEMFRILSHHVETIGCYPNLSGGWIDHVHVLCGLSRTVSISDLVKHLKIETSKWAKETSNGVKVFSWQAGYGAFSVSQSNLDQVIDYIARQEEHHKSMSFQDELRALCRKHGLQIDEKYAWD